MTVAIVGLGQIGSSLGAAILRRGLDSRVIGIVRRWDSAKTAVTRRIAHEVTTDLEAVRVADVVVLATPVLAILKLIPEIARRVKPGALLTDVGSTKAEVLKAAASVRSRTFSFIGGHPMAGNEKAGIDGCNPGLFADRPWILVKAFTARPGHPGWLERFLSGTGARVVWMKDGERHDRIVAEISHLPHLLAYALLGSAGGGDLSLAGGSFLDATRVAGSPVDMVMDFLLTNRKHLPGTVRTFLRMLNRLSDAVRRGDRRALRKMVEAARARRSDLLLDRPSRI